VNNRPVDPFLNIYNGYTPKEAVVRRLSPTFGVKEGAVKDNFVRFLIDRTLNGRNDTGGKLCCKRIGVVEALSHGCIVPKEGEAVNIP